MTLNEITSQLDERYGDWGAAYQPDLARISREPAIRGKIISFIHYAVRHTPEHASPVEAVKHALSFAGLSTFQLGLLVGLLLHDNSLPHEAATPEAAPLPKAEILGDQIQLCFSCDSSGEVCFHCSFSRCNCECPPGRYSPVRCAMCDGTGELDA